MRCCGGWPALPATSPLWERSDVIIAPHISGDYIGCHEDMVVKFVDNFRRYVRREALVDIVDKQRGCLVQMSDGSEG